MRITAIKPLPVWVGNRNQLVVKVETDEGISGLGESGLSGRELAVIGALKHFREFLIGKDPMQIGRIWQELYRSQYFEGGRVLLAAQSAIDIALYDIVGKALNVPVYQLLGGKQREEIPCFATATGAGPALIDDVKLLMAHGWRVIRTAPDDARRCRRFHWRHRHLRPARQHPRHGQMADESTRGMRQRDRVGHRLSPPPQRGRDRVVLPAPPRGHPGLPGRADSRREPEAYAALRRLTPVPFAVGEEFASKWQFLPFIEQHLTDFARVDICNVGGFTEAMKVAGWAEAHYIDSMPHNPLGPVCATATIHLAAAVPNFAWLEVRVTQTENLYYGESGMNDADALFPVQPRLAGTSFPVPTGPGLGVEIDERLAEAQTWRFWEAPHWRRPDGSVSNW